MSRGTILQEFWDNLPEERRDDIEAAIKGKIEEIKMQKARVFATLNLAHSSDMVTFVLEIQKNGELRSSTSQLWKGTLDDPLIMGDVAFEVAHTIGSFAVESVAVLGELTSDMHKVFEAHGVTLKEVPFIPAPEGIN